MFVLRNFYLYTCLILSKAHKNRYVFLFYNANADIKEGVHDYIGVTTMTISLM